MLCRTSLRTLSCNRIREDQPKGLRPFFYLHRSPNIRAAQEPACTPRRCSRNRPHTMSTRTDSKRPRQPRPELRCTAVRPVRALRRAPRAALLPQLLHPSQPPPPRIRPPQTRRPNPSWNSCDSRRSCSARWKLSKHACSAFPLRWIDGYSGSESTWSDAGPDSGSRSPGAGPDSQPCSAGGWPDSDWSSLASHSWNSGVRFDLRLKLHPYVHRFALPYRRRTRSPPADAAPPRV